MNFILKHNKQNPHEVVLTMMRLISVGVLFRVSMTFLKANEKTILDKIDSSSVANETKLSHKTKIRKILKYYYPPPEKQPSGNPEDGKRDFTVMERWIGHDLLTKSIMQNLENGSQTMGFGNDMLELQWDAFVRKERQLNRIVRKDKPAMRVRATLKEPPISTKEKATLKEPPLLMNSETKRKGITDTEERYKGKYFSTTK